MKKNNNVIAVYISNALLAVIATILRNVKIDNDCCNVIQLNYNREKDSFLEICINSETNQLIFQECIFTTTGQPYQKVFKSCNYRCDDVKRFFDEVVNYMLENKIELRTKIIINCVEVKNPYSYFDNLPVQFLEPLNF